MQSDRIIYFGDSLTDSGAFFSLASQLTVFPQPSALFGYAGQFSNGDVYADIAPEILGIGADESVNYAVGGAEAIGSFPLGLALATSPLGVEDPDPALLAFDGNLSAQVTRFLEDAPALGDLSNSAASFFIGLNDFNGLTAGIDPASFDPVAFAGEATQLAARTGQATVQSAFAAAQAGVGTIIINTLPVGSFFPLGNALPGAFVQLAEDLIRGFNDQLTAAALDLEALGVTVRIVDFEALADEVSVEGQTFGFLNTDQALLNGTGANPGFVDPDGEGPLPPQPFFDINPALAALDPDQFAFYDLLHPTTALHGVLGAFQAATLSSESIQFLGAGDDVLRAGSGDDLVFGQAGEDILRLGRGDDVAFGGADDDVVRGGGGSDIAAGGAGDDRILGGGGADVVAGNTGDDRLWGGRGDDAIVDGLGSDMAFGGAGNDVFFHAEASLIGGSPGTDRDIFFGGSGYDTLYLVVADENRAAVAGNIDAGGGWFGIQTFREIGLTTVGIEEIVLLGNRAGFDTVAVSDALQATLDEAEYWGLV